MLPFARGWQFTVFLGTFNKKSLTEDNMQHLNLGFEEMMRWWTFDSESHRSKPFNYRMAWYKRVLWYLLTIPTAKMVFCSPGVEATLTKNTNCGASSTSSSWRRPQKRTCPETTCFDRFPIIIFWHSMNIFNLQKLSKDAHSQHEHQTWLNPITILGETSEQHLECRHAKRKQIFHPLVLIC